MHVEEFGEMDDPIRAAREDRERAETLVNLAQRMVVVFAILLIGCGGLRTLGQGLSEELAEENVVFGKFIFKSRTHHYATASSDLLSGILYAVAAIGIFAREPWAKKLNLVSAVVFVGTATALELHEWLGLGGDPFESFSDVLFWCALPLIQIVMLWVGDHKLAVIAADGATAPADAA